MSEKDTFLATHNREYQTTRRVISAFPVNQANFRPHERSRSASELAFTIANEELFFLQSVEGHIDFSILGNPAPASMVEILKKLDENCKQVDQIVRATSDADLNVSIEFAGRNMRRLDVLWAVLFDLVHHRGQFSVYLRMAGGKVPSIYGPSADDPGLAVAAA